MMKHSNTDWKRNNKIALRNFHEAVDFHDVVKLMLVRMLRKKNQNNSKIPIYTEFSPDFPNEEYPDIWMRIKHDVYVWEIQENFSKSWEEKIIKKYEDVNLILIPLKELREKYIKKLYSKKNQDPFKVLRELLEIYVV